MGKTWTKLPKPPGKLYRLYSTDDKNGWALGRVADARDGQDLDETAQAAGGDLPRLLRRRKERLGGRAEENRARNSRRRPKMGSSFYRGATTGGRALQRLYLDCVRHAATGRDYGMEHSAAQRVF